MIPMLLYILSLIFISTTFIAVMAYLSEKGGGK